MVEFYPQTIYYPREEVDKKFARGELSKVVERLLAFVQRHVDIIIELAKDETEHPGDMDLLDAVRILVLSKGTIHPPSEMAAMIQEINKEIWYQGEKGEKDISKIQELWEQKYAFQYREARLFEVFIVLEKVADQVLATLRPALKDT